ncbi:MAG: hypothetical protein PHE29_04965 [Tissierellia bacterium]|nr:hypothetical protein [Tissierellia bacterium]
MKKKDLATIPNLLLKQLDNYILKNINIYEKEGFKINFNCKDCFLDICYNTKDYKVNIITFKNNYYWRMEPYTDSYFTTGMNNQKQDFDLILFAIKENDLLERKE